MKTCYTPLFSKKTTQTTLKVIWAVDLERLYNILENCLKGGFYMLKKVKWYPNSPERLLGAFYEDIENEVLEVFNPHLLKNRVIGNPYIKIKWLWEIPS